MPQPKKEDERTRRDKQREHGAQSDQGAAGQTTTGPRGPTSPPMYEGPEEQDQQRRSEQTDQRRS